MRSARRYGLSVGVGVVAVVTMLAIVSCTPLVPFRTQPYANQDCTPGNMNVDPTLKEYGSVDSSCARLIEEVEPTKADQPGYELHFVEFDDQGRLLGNAATLTAASSIDDFLAHVRNQNGDTNSGYTSVVVFVHGWKHNAAVDDDNVRLFRTMLHNLGTIEAQATCPRHVVGLYIGWRGDATTLPDWAKDTTFWTRKAAATRVADGEIRELFGRLRAIQDIRNRDWNKVVQASIQTPETTTNVSRATVNCNKKMRLTIVGHSFGGLVVYNALGPSLIHDLGDLTERILNTPDKKADPYLAREGDLIVTINAAVEAASFEPLWKAARNAKPRSYHGPVFVSITSDNDDATGIAFPAARFFSTIFNRYPPGDTQERAAARETIGHDADLIDYQLNKVSLLNQNDPSLQLAPDPDCVTSAALDTFAEQFGAESQRIDDLAEALSTTRDANKLSRDYFPRQFCLLRPDGPDASIALVPKKNVNLNSPVWNIETARPVLNDHSDLLNPLLLDVLRQLYEEGTKPQTQHVIFQRKLTETTGEPPAQ